MKRSPNEPWLDNQKCSERDKKGIPTDYFRTEKY